MPYDMSTFQLPCGARCVRVECFGTIDRADADGLVAQLDPGGPLHGLPILALIQRMDGITSDARGFLAGREARNQLGWSGVVVTNPVIRVTLNFMFRFIQSNKQRMFPSEAAAIQWLDERAREDAAKVKRGAEDLPLSGET